MTKVSIANYQYSLNRYSMPVTKSRTGIQELLSLDQTNTTRFLFGDDDAAVNSGINKFLEMNSAENQFPVLLRGAAPNMVSS